MTPVDASPSPTAFEGMRVRENRLGKVLTEFGNRVRMVNGTINTNSLLDKKCNPWVVLISIKSPNDEQVTTYAGPIVTGWRHGTKICGIALTDGSLHDYDFRDDCKIFPYSFPDINGNRHPFANGVDEELLGVGSRAGNLGTICGIEVVILSTDHHHFDHHIGVLEQTLGLAKTLVTREALPEMVESRK
ncbi:MAG: hypothetical protein WCT01_02450 [Candidatus Shapirobacteria bacterium]